MSLLTRLAGALKGAKNGYFGQFWTPDRQWRPLTPNQTARTEIPQVRGKILAWSREMEKRDSLFIRFLQLCEQYVIGANGLRMLSASEDRNFAAIANNDWEGWSPYCDIATRHSFGQRQGLIDREINVAGEAFVYLTFGENNNPRIQLFEAELIETPGDDRAKDKSICDGIKLDPNGRELSYFIRQEDLAGTKSWKEISADNMAHLYDPSRVSQGRGLPALYPILKELIDLGELQDFEMIAAKDAALLSKVIKTANGEQSAADLRRFPRTLGGISSTGSESTKQRDEYYKDAAPHTLLLRQGDDVSQFASARPSVAVQSFWDFVSARAGAGLGLPIEIMIMRSLQGTMGRGAFDMANGFFRCRTAERAEQFGRIWEHVIGNSPNPKLFRSRRPIDWRKTKYTPPRAINVDVGRNMVADIAAYQEGFKTLDMIVGPDGMTAEEVMRQRCRDFKRAREIEIEEGVPGGTALPLPEQPQPEVVPIQNQNHRNRIALNSV